MTPSTLLSALQLRNRFTLESVADLPLFHEAGLEHYHGPIWVVGPKTYNWICRQRGWREHGVANALGCDVPHCAPVRLRGVFGGDGAEMRVLVACEYSGRVREAFRAKGHDAWSCDLLPSEDNSPHHIQGDCWSVLSSNGWDMVIAFPPCTDLCNSGSRWWPEKRADGRQRRSIEFFLRFTSVGLPWAIENPVGIMSTHYRKPDQIIQPWQFGHGETKATCLWLNGLPKLQPTNIVEGRTPRVHFMPPSKDRWKERSRTYQGIADAMAEQWSVAMVRR